MNNFVCTKITKHVEKRPHCDSVHMMKFLLVQTWTVPIQKIVASVRVIQSVVSPTLNPKLIPELYGQQHNEQPS